MQVLKHVFSLILVVFYVTRLAGCVTSGKPEYKETEVIERMESYDKTPDFAIGSRIMWSEGNKVYFSQIEELSGDGKSSACLKMAAIQAKANILKHIKEGITQSGQVNEQGTEGDAGYESLTAFLSQGTINSASVEEQYYDKREISTASGERTLKLHCAAKVSISKSELQRLLKEATGSGGNAEIRAKLLKAQTDFIEGLGEDQPVAH